MPARRIKSLFVLAGLALSGLALISWTQQWFTLALTGASSAQHSIAVGGDTAAPAILALSLAALASLAALTLAGPFFRRVLGVLQALLGASIVLSAATALGDPIGASAELVTKATGVSGTESVQTLVASVAQTPWPWIALVLGVLIAALGAGLLGVGTRWPHASRRFQAGSAEPDETAPSSASDWDSLSGGSDPTSR